MDRWILSFTQSLLIFVRREMAAYRLYTVVPKLMKFIDNLTNWYVRMNRKRFKVSIPLRRDLWIDFPEYYNIFLFARENVARKTV